MKKLVFALMLMMVVSFSVSANNPMRRSGSINVQYFYNELAPYGDWIYSVDYGYVWRPYFDRPDFFRPYSSGGHWAYTNYGWTWVSDYDWGWATFHYGRWYYDDYLGWMWIPGYEWAPAWVSWGSYNNYWGWAPLGPNAMVGVSVDWYAPDIWWTFVPRRHFCSTSWHNHIYHNNVNVNNITIINNVYVDNDSHHRHNSWYEGPRVNDVERYGRTRVNRNEVVDIQHPSDIRRATQGRVNVYRPEIDRNDNNHRPSEFRNAENMRTGTRAGRTSAHENEPGMSRTRESRPETGRTNRTGIEVNTRSGSTAEPSGTTRPVNVNRNENRSSTTGTERYSKPENTEIRNRETERNTGSNSERRNSGNTEIRKRTETGSTSTSGTGSSEIRKRTEAGSTSSAGNSRPSVQNTTGRSDSSVGRTERTATENRSVRSNESNSKPSSTVRTGSSSSTSRPSSTETKRSESKSTSTDNSIRATRPGR